MRMKSTTQDIKEIRLKNLLNLIKQEGSQIAFSRKVDIDSSHISQIKNPNNKKNLGEKLARKIEASLNLPIGWMDRDHTNLPIKDAIPVTYKVPILDYIQAGNFTNIDYDGIEPVGGWDMVTEDLKDTFALIIRGDSMEPTLKEGMIVYIRPQPTAEIGDIVVAQINGDTEATIKRFKKDAGTIYLVPDNKEYDTIKITPDDNKELKIIGKAIAARINL